MRVVMSYEAPAGVDVDIESVQYSKLTKAVCRCYYGTNTECIYSKRTAFALDVKKALRIYIASFKIPSIRSVSQTFVISKLAATRQN